MSTEHVASRIRVAVIVPGGVGTGYHSQGVPALMSLISGLSRTFDLTVYSMVSVDAGYEPEGFRVRWVEADHREATVRRMFRLARMVVADHRRQPYELFHGIWAGAPGTLAVLLGKLFRRPSLVSMRGGETAAVKSISYGYLNSRIRRLWLFATLRGADSLSALTQSQVEALNRHGFSRPVEIIPYGVDTTIFAPVEQQLRAPFTFIHIANLTEVKDQETLLRAFRIIRDEIDCRLEILGADYLDGRIQEFCETLQLSEDVSFLGPVRNSELPRYFARAHVLLHTSLYEGQAVVVAEAAACKVLVCGTRTGLIADLDHETVSVEPRDHEGLARATLSILADPEAYWSIVERAYQWARTHDIEYTVGRYRRLYETLRR